MDTLRNYTFLPWTRRGSRRRDRRARRSRHRAAPRPERAAVSVSFNVNGRADREGRRGPRPRRRRRHQPARDRQDRSAQLGHRLRIKLPAVHRVLRRRFSVALHAGHRGQRARAEPAAAVDLPRRARGRRVHRAQDAAARCRPSSSRKVSIPHRSFRRPDQTWAWAHVHVSQNIIGNSLQTTTDQEVSRRRAEPAADARGQCRCRLVAPAVRAQARRRARRITRS